MNPVRGKKLLPFLLTASLLSLPCASPSPAQDRVRVGLSAISATSGSLWVAEEKGLFKKHRIDPEVIVIGGGGGRVVSALIAGDIQFSIGGGDAAIRAKLKGVDVVMIASPLTKGLQRVLARPDIARPEDLKGKKVGEQINIETDVLAKYIEKLINKDDSVQNTKLTENRLKELGY